MRTGLLDRLGICAVLFILAGCAGVSDPSTATGGAFTIDADAIEISGPGEGRVALSMSDTVADPAITAPSGMTAVIEHSGTSLTRRVLVITASAPGSGFVRLSNPGNADSIAVNARQVAFTQIAVSFGYGCGLTAVGRAWCWGANGTHQIGALTNPPCVGIGCQAGDGGSAKYPLPVLGSSLFAKIAVSGRPCLVGQVMGGCGSSCAITPVVVGMASGSTLCWGVISGGEAPRQLGAQSAVQMATISTSTDLSSTALVMGGFACGATTSNDPRCSTLSGVAGIATTQNFSSLVVGPTHMCGISGSDVWCRGDNVDGELGIGVTDFTNHVSPEKAVASVSFTDVRVGEKQSCALATNQKIYCWGRGNPTPAVLPGTGTYTSFDLSSWSSSVCGLTSVGTVDCWSSFTAQPAPVQSSVTFTQVGVGGLGTTEPLAGLARSCGLTSSGEVYCWGGDLQARKLGG